MDIDTIYLRGLKVETVIGIFDWERAIRQRVVIDLEMSANIAAAAATDRIEQTLDYKGVAKRIIAFVEASEFQLVETLAERIATLIRDEFGVGWLRVRVGKPGAIRGADDVGVVIERGARAAV